MIWLLVAVAVVAVFCMGLAETLWAEETEKSVNKIGLIALASLMIGTMLVFGPPAIVVCGVGAVTVFICGLAVADKLAP